MIDMYMLAVSLILNICFYERLHWDWMMSNSWAVRAAR